MVLVDDETLFELKEGEVEETMKCSSRLRSMDFDMDTGHDADTSTLLM